MGILTSEAEVTNRLADLRQKRGLSASQLASMVGVSRQSIYAMESGSYVPNTVIALKLAQILAVTVEDIFLLQERSSSTKETEAELLTRITGTTSLQAGHPLHLCDVHGRLVAVPSESDSWSLPIADAIFIDSLEEDQHSGKVKVEILNEEQSLEKRILLAGCDPSAPVLGRYLQKHGIDLVVSYQNSSQSLELLKQGLVHVAGTHITEGEKEAAELAAMRRSFREEPIAVIRYALWEEGIVVAKENPRKIQGIADFSRKNVKIVNREPGAGCRVLLDEHLKKLGISTRAVRGYGHIEWGHLPAARHVQTGEADCCISTRATAKVLGLEFIPLVSKWYDLVFLKKTLALPSAQALLQTLTHSPFRRELEGLWGYDMRSAGTELV